MQAVTTIGLDIAKLVFQVHGVDAAGQVLIRRQLRLAPRRTTGRASSKHSAIRCG